MTAVRAVKRGLLRVAVRAAEASLEAIGIRRPSALLLLGHMRSGSTLLLHLLLTNPEISAVGERNATYSSKDDLARLVIATRVARRIPFARLRYVVDQVNHTRFTPSRRVLEDPRVRVIFLLRRPGKSLSSLLTLSRTHYDSSWSVTRAVDYYVERLQALADFAERFALDDRAAFVTYEQLMAQPTDTLSRLQTFLGLRGGFSETYATHRFTGKRGDPGPHILAGRIRRNGSATPVELPPDEHERAAQAYARCREALARFALGTAASDA